MTATMVSEQEGGGIRQRQGKVERYGWDELSDEQGVAIDLRLDELEIDHTYQRRLESKSAQNRILRIARHWSWHCCGVIVVGERLDGRFVVIDGQCRLMAARRRGDIESLPCLVFKMRSVQDEAKIFLGMNDERTPVRTTERHRASLTFDEVSMLIEELVQEAGRRVSACSSASTFTSVGLMKRLLTGAESTRQSLLDVWPLVLEVCQGQPIHCRILETFTFIEDHLPRGESITKGIWKRRILKLGYQRLLQVINNAAVLQSRGGVSVWAGGVVGALNHGLRDQSRLELVRKTERKG